ncbi:hypothetical protein FOZ62_009503, partial [Perkinsus olseni]
MPLGTPEGWESSRLPSAGITISLASVRLWPPALAVEDDRPPIMMSSSLMLSSYLFEVIVEWWMSSEHSSERGVTQADLKQVDIDAEFKSSSSSDGSESEGEDDGRPESTPEMLMRAVAVGGELAKQMTDKWVSDNQTGLKYCYSGSEKKLFMWNPRSQSMYHWKGRGSMDFMWQANQSSQQQHQQQGRAQPQAAVGEAPKSSDDAEQADHEEKVLWMTYIPSSYLWGKDPQKNMDSPEDSAEENEAAGDDEESEPSSATEPKHKKARMAADNAS